MYKVSEVSNILGVESSKIFEQLITYKKILDPTTIRDGGLLYLTDDTIKLLRGYLSISHQESQESDFLLLKAEIEQLQDKIYQLDLDIQALDLEQVELAASLLKETDRYLSSLKGGKHV